ncbi:hypothetical protein [Nonomuraea roseoviolacea]|uniref:Uncharacterized protein n=1 Tax=Nonomuraea roseoviolacea subsp. carminata TaxID=160689 RepID=A0ABT1K5Z4_9ACTN|nr:hypothetical protein [Nonomuraea roseoviolacea]MCP2349425.1 hypothetical protein [Nonomuraea roseoviolacea subsp. carminata]
MAGTGAFGGGGRRARARVVRAATVFAALGVLWWASVRVVWTAAGCDDWGCLAPVSGLVVLVTVAVLAGGGWALERVAVRPGRRTAVVAAGALVSLGLLGQVLPSWAWPPAHAVLSATAFGAAGAAAAFLTAPEPRGRWKLALVLALAVLPPATLVLLWTTAS